ncbi:TPA: pentapeptide repeat-containing protein [Campylobacter jejuni]|nr:pentapeptide repeat-containing protein [Campylobacter jejuni]
MKYKWIVKNAYIDFKLNNLYMLINPSDKIYLEEDVCYYLEIYIKYRIFNNCILVCDMLDNWWKLISSTLHLDKSHIKYNYLSNTFIVSDFELGIKLESNLLTKFNFEFYNGLILNQLSITNGLSFKRENYNKSLKFSNCKFNKEFCIARININKQIVFENIYFLDNAFIEWVNFNENSCLRFFKCNFKKQCNFKYNIFYNEIDFLDIYAKELILEQNIFNKFLYIQNSTIDNINLWKNKFKNRCYFVDSKFGYKDKDNTTKLNFSNTHFEDNAYFNNSEFYSYADFHECEFEKTASFYGVRFEKTPNFSQAIFKGNLNAVNTNLNFTFDNLQERIKQEYKDFNKTKEEKPLDKIANDFRDSFRIFKNALIKDNNALDASNFHKYELYCKEIELKESWNKLKKVDIDEDIDQNNKNYSKLMDFLLLGFYRKLCDHHTDFLKVFNNLILLIALYALFVFGFTWLHDDKLEDTRAILTLFGFFDKFRLYFDIISAIFVVFGCGFFVCKLNSYEKKNNVSKKQNINFIYIIGDFWNLTKSLFFASFISCVFYVLFSLFGFFLNLDKDFGYSLLINTLFVGLYICLVYTKSLFFGRYVVLIFSYIGFIIMLIKQPSVIHPLIGKIANESDKFFNYPSLIVLNILYTILLALVLFSLQKTARKNSIVPS